MATAPRPKPESRDEEADRRSVTQTLFTFTAGDETYRIAPYNVPIREKLAAQAQTGMSWEDIIRPFVEGRSSTASFAVIVWLARRCSGEPRLTWDQFAAEWDATSIGDEITVEVSGPDGDDPEA